MSVTPSDDDFDWAALEAEVGDVDVSGVRNVTSLTNWELTEQYHVLTQELQADGTEALRPTQQTSRDRHSLRNACFVEMKRRGLL